MKKIPFIKYRKTWLALALITLVIGAGMLLKWGLKPGIDFTGGSLFELSFGSAAPATEQIEQNIKSQGVEEVIVQRSSDNRFIIRTGFLNEDQHQKVIGALRKEFENKDRSLTEDRFETIGATISQQLRQRSLWAVILVSLSIILYVAFAFRQVNRPLPSWQYGLIAIITLLYVVVIVGGVFAALGRFKGVEVDVAFVVAILTVLGYSVNDSIVVYDRIRENLTRNRIDDFGELVNTGLNETLARSINTVAAVLFPLFALYFFGGSTVHYFALALLLGMAISTISSIFVASPLLVVAEEWQRKKA